MSPSASTERTSAQQFRILRIELAARPCNRRRRRRRRAPRRHGARRDSCRQRCQAKVRVRRLAGERPPAAARPDGKAKAEAARMATPTWRMPRQQRMNHDSSIGELGRRPARYLQQAPEYPVAREWPFYCAAARLWNKRPQSVVTRVFQHDGRLLRRMAAKSRQPAALRSITYSDSSARRRLRAAPR